MTAPRRQRPHRSSGSSGVLDRNREAAGAFLGWSARAVGNFGRDVCQTYRTRGTRAAASVVVGWGVTGLRRARSNLTQYRAESSLGLDTGREWSVGAEVAGSALYGDGTMYMATPAGRFTALLAELPVPDPERFAFVDLGCGKGSVLILAARHGYGRVIGVELDSSLVEVARANVAAAASELGVRAGAVEVVRADAALFELPEIPLVVYLYNPFGEQTLRAVREELERSMTESPRPMVVAYYNPVHRDVFDGSARLRVLRASEEWATYVSVSS
jgi:SAM-dependent methyltransferase